MIFVFFHLTIKFWFNKDNIFLYFFNDNKILIYDLFKNNSFFFQCHLTIKF